MIRIPVNASSRLAYVQVIESSGGRKIIQAVSHVCNREIYPARFSRMEEFPAMLLTTVRHQSIPGLLALPRYPLRFV